MCVREHMQKERGEAEAPSRTVFSAFNEDVAPPGTFGHVCRRFVRRECYWHLEGRVQGAAEHPSLPDRESPSPRCP